MRFFTALGLFILFVAHAGSQERQGGVINMRGDRGAPVPALGMPLYESGIVVHTDLTRVAIQIKTKRGQLKGFAIDPKCEIKADKKQFGKKKLLLSEVEPDYQVDLTVRQADMNVIEMKVKRPPKSEN